MAAYIPCVGTSSQIGACHGRGARKQILSSLENYRSLFASLTPPIEWSKAVSIATKFIPTLERHIPSALEEVREIASSANISFEDILVLNCRSEIGLTGGSSDGCSAIAYKDPITGKQLLAQNWDWHGNQLDNVIVLDIAHLDGTRVVTITEAGIVGKVGFNGNGVGVTLNAIRTEGVLLDYSMLPIHFALRYIVMESLSAKEAIDRLTRIGVASTAHFLIADAISAYGVEVSPLGNEIILPDSSGFVLHTNHWISSPERVKSVAWLPDTYARLNRLEHLKSNVRSLDDIWEVLADEDEQPGSICRRTADRGGPDNDLETLFGVVMNLEVGEAELVHGRPTRGRLRTTLPKTGPMGSAGSHVKHRSI